MKYDEKALNKEEDFLRQEIFEDTPGRGKFFFKKDKIVLDKILKNQNQEWLSHMEYVVGNYFQTRTLQFMYFFCRNELKMSRRFKRWLVMPLGFSSFLILPWVVLDIIDSFVFRILYTRHCKECDWKFHHTAPTGNHDPDECEYNKEYSMVLMDILSGNIAKSETSFQQISKEKQGCGKKSAYEYLCSTRATKLSSGFDIFCVWGSILLMISIAVYLIVPILYVLLMHTSLDGLNLR